MKFTTIASFAFLICLLILPAESFGAWVLVDDFEAGDSFSGGTHSTVTDPYDATNTMLTFSADSATMNLPAGQRILDGTTGTVFFQAVYPDTGRDISFGMSEQDAGDNWGDYLSQVLFLNSAINVRDGNGSGGGGTTTVVPSVTTEEPYNFWLVIDEDAGSYDVYGSGPGITGQALLADDYGFRRTANPGDIDQLLLREGGGGSGNMLFDNIYIDPSGANLADPLATVPEPGTFFLAFVGLVGFAFVRRSRRCKKV